MMFRQEADENPHTVAVTIARQLRMEQKRNTMIGRKLGTDLDTQNDGLDIVFIFLGRMNMRDDRCGHVFPLSLSLFSKLTFISHL